MMGYASYLVWQNGAPHLPLTLYGIQLVMNLAWSPIFFKAKEIGYSLLDQVGGWFIISDSPVLLLNLALTKLISLDQHMGSMLDVHC